MQIVGAIEVDPRIGLFMDMMSSLCYSQFVLFVRATETF
jgi:hypothetical protein